MIVKTFKIKKNINKKQKIILIIIFFLLFFLNFNIINKLLNIKIINNKNNYESSFIDSLINRKYKIVAISYSNNKYLRQLELNKKSALEVGKVDEHYSYGPNDIDQEFREKNKNILSIERGNGLWLWKPYIINKTIVEKLNEGDYLIYTDAAMIFMNSSYLLINFLKENNASMWMNRLKWKELQFSKRDAFILMGVDTPIFSETYQYMAGIQIYKKSEYTVKFIQNWLNYCQDKRIVSDDRNTLKYDNYPGFISNRHDQTALSLLIKKYGEANSGSPNLSLSELKKRKSIIMPNILCMYRRMPFQNYEDLKRKCIKIIEEQYNYFS